MLLTSPEKEMSVYSFLRNEREVLPAEEDSWKARFLPVEAEGDNQPYGRIHALGDALMTVKAMEPYEKIIYRNYAGVWVFGCSFKGIQGSMSQMEGLALLKQNGGMIDE